MVTQLVGSTGVDERRGNWIQTFSGRRYYLGNPDPADVCIEDVAHALAHICRFTGHTRKFYSVAEHCVRVSDIVEQEIAEHLQQDEVAPPCTRPLWLGRRCDQEGPGGFMGHTCQCKMSPERAGLWGLLHDAPEAYIGDVSRPLKHAPGMEGYAVIEARAEWAVLERFGLAYSLDGQDEVKRADLMMLCVEARDLLGITDFEAAGWRYWMEPRPDLYVQGWTPQVAEREYLRRFAELTRKGA